MKPVSLVTFLATITTLGTASAAWQRLPNSGDRPADLASKAMPATTIVSSEGIGKSAALLSDEVTDVATLSAGKSSAIIQLSGQQIIDMASFVNSGAEGKVTLSGSANGREWGVLSQEVFSSGDRYVSASFAGAQVKFIKIDFDLSSGGYISSFETLGGLSGGDFNVGDASSNLAGSVGGARPIYAHPAPSNVGEKDFDVNVFRFGKTDEKCRTVIYDLGTPRKVSSFSSSYSVGRPVRIDAFAFDTLPEQKDWRGKLTLDPAIFDQVRPVASGEDSRGLGMLKITPSKSVTAQYIAIRFEPNYQVASNGDQWSDFVAFALAPYLQTGAVLNSATSGAQVAGDSGSGFTAYSVGIMLNGGNGKFNQNFSPNDGPSNNTSTEGAETFSSGAPPWGAMSPFGYTARSTGGYGGSGNPFGLSNVTPPNTVRPLNIRFRAPIINNIIQNPPDDEPTSGD